MSRNVPPEKDVGRAADPTTGLSATNTAVEAIARALLYEGYVLYPYRADALKNRHRWTVGGLVPRAYGERHAEPWSLQAECLIHGDADSRLSVGLRFLRPVGTASLWQEAVEEQFIVPDLPLVGQDSQPVRWTYRAGPDDTPVTAAVEFSSADVGDSVFRIRVRAENHTALDDANVTRDEAMLRGLASAHVVLGVRGGRFVSLADPPAELKALADGCRNVGVWPVLVGDPGRCDTVLASPIILEDFPRVAPESPGDFFDGTEIDEMLALRIRTLTDDEKRQMATLDPRTRALLERVEGLSDAGLARLHGAVRTPRPGDRVRLRPNGRADAFDLLLAGKSATVASVETDFEGNTYVTVTVDDDPGRDLGATGMPGHRFFFRPDEVELL
jgi:hypothetical protein